LLKPKHTVRYLLGWYRGEAKVSALGRQFLYVSCVALAASLLLPGQNAKAMWQLSISVPLSHDERIISLDPSQHFHVLLTNVSGQSQKFWKESCSWGYSVLSLELTNELGKKAVVKKKPRSWRKNFPDFWTIQPGGSLVFDVYLGGESWEGLPAAEFGSNVRVRALIEVPADEDARRLGVWTGHLSSEAEACVLQR